MIATAHVDALLKPSHGKINIMPLIGLCVIVFQKLCCINNNNLLKNVFIIELNNIVCIDYGDILVNMVFVSCVFYL